VSGSREGLGLRPGAPSDGDRTSRICEIGRGSYEAGSIEQMCLTTLPVASPP
jgi:hypothetical protein